MVLTYKLLSLLCLLCLLTRMNSLSKDLSSMSNPNEIITRHIDLNWTISFPLKRISGSITLDMTVLTSITSIQLDTSHLFIHSVNLLPSNHSLPFNITSPYPQLGSLLSIQHVQGQGSVRLIIYYHTLAGDKSAINWLEREQTAGQIGPYMFTQSPLQDTPLVRFTYNASISIPSSLSAHMSAYHLSTVSLSKTQMKTIVFYQPVAVASYLIAIAVGDIIVSSLSNNTYVLSEPIQHLQAVKAFSSLPVYYSKAIDLFGASPFVSYSILIMPSSFPYSAMENPCLVFASPATIQTDTAPIMAMHEIAHNWYGNSIGIANWVHLWLKEGLAVYGERLLATFFMDSRLITLQAQIGVKGMISEMTMIENAYRPLLPQIERNNPDDAFSSIVYEKGYCLLKLLEKQIGIQQMKAFMKYYAQKYKGMAHTSHDFRDAFLFFCQKKQLKTHIDWNKWFYGTGLPYKPDQKSTLYDNAIQLSNQYLSKKKIIKNKQQYQSFYPSQKQVFLQNILENLKRVDRQIIKKLIKDFKYDQEKFLSLELMQSWYQLCISAKFYYKDLPKQIKKYLSTNGQSSQLLGLYRIMFQSSDKNINRFAKQVYQKNLSFYHPIIKIYINKLMKDKKNDQNKIKKKLEFFDKF